jgi:hypothetical protein
MQNVQKIACANAAGFVMNFSIRWLDASGNWFTTHWNSGNYPIDQTRTSPDLASIGVPPDALAVSPYVHAILGKSGEGTPYVAYAANGNVGTYTVSGTTLDYSVKLNQ